MSYQYPGGLKILATEVVVLQADHLFLGTSYEHITENWDVASQLGSSIWSDTLDAFDLDALDADLIARGYFWRAYIQGDFLNTTNTVDGCQIGIGVDGNDPSQFSLFAAEAASSVGATNRFPLVTLNATMPWVPSTAGASHVEPYGAVFAVSVGLLGSTATWFQIEIGVIG